MSTWQNLLLGEFPEVGRSPESWSAVEERFTYLIQDVLRKTVVTPSTREVLVSQLNSRTFSQLRGYIEYLTSRDVADSLSQDFLFPKRR